MSGVGFWELMLIFLIGLIVLGPERLPRVAQQLGTWLGQARRMTRMMRRQLEEELDLEKDKQIRPRSHPLPHPARDPRPQEPPAEKADTYSPAHAADSPGTGVAATGGNDEAGQAPPADADDADPATKPAEAPAQERVS